MALMPRIKQHEVMVYRAVESGEFTIDRQGRIWRVRRRYLNRHSGVIASHPCPRKRADYASGARRMIRVSFDRRSYETTASRLVWQHFNGPIPKGMLIKHVNGREDDNRPLATPSEMQIHRLRVLKLSRGLLKQNGERNRAVKLGPKQVREMRKRRTARETVTALAERFGVSIATVSNVCTGKRWAEVR